MKKIIGVYRNNEMHWVGDGFPVYTLFSYQQSGQLISPFLLLDYAEPYSFEPSDRPRGVGSHPHRGFETVTLAYQGEVTHQDSHGGGGTIQTGDVQWMTAAAGLVHEEFHSTAFTQQGGLFEMVQLWVNLPAKDKMVAPKYQSISAQQIPVVEFSDHTGQLRVIAGEYNGSVGPASTYSPVNVWDAKLNAGSTQTIQVPAEHNVLVIVLNGEVIIDGDHKIQHNSVVVFARDSNTELSIEALQETKLLVLTGEPLNEPIQGYGPFVMNTKQEIIQAFDDFNQGKFGEIVETT